LIAARVKIGTPQGAKAVLHRLTRGKPAGGAESSAQLEFQSMVLTRSTDHFRKVAPDLPLG
jgi:hypothetical protein